MTALSPLLLALALAPASAFAAVQSGAACSGQCQDSYAQYLTLYCGQPAVSDACDKRFSEQYSGLLSRWGEVCADTCEKLPDGDLRDSCEDERERKCAVYAEVSKTRPSENLLSSAEWAEDGQHGGFGALLASQKQDLADYKCGRAAAETLYANFAKKLWTSKGLQRELQRETDPKDNGFKCEADARLPAAKGFLPSFGYKKRSRLPAGDLIKVYLGDAAQANLAKKVAFLKRLEKGNQASDAEKAQFLDADAVASLDRSSRLKKDLKRAQKDSESEARQFEKGRAPLTMADAAPGTSADSASPGNAAPTFWTPRSEAEAAGKAKADAEAAQQQAASKLQSDWAAAETAVDGSLNELSVLEKKLKARADQDNPQVKKALADVQANEAALQKAKAELAGKASQAALDKFHGDYANVNAASTIAEASPLANVDAIDQEKPSDAAMKALGDLAHYQGTYSGKDKGHLFDPRTAALDKDYAALKGQPLDPAESKARDAVAAELRRRVMTNCGKPALPWKLMGDFLGDTSLPDHAKLAGCAYAPGSRPASAGSSSVAGAGRKGTADKIKAATGQDAPPNTKPDSTWQNGDQTVSEYAKNQLGDKSEMTVTWAPAGQPQAAYQHYLRVISGPYTIDGDNIVLKPGAKIEYRTEDGQPQFYTASSVVTIPKSSPDDMAMSDRGGLKPDAAAAKQGASLNQVSLGDRMEHINPKDGSVNEIDWNDGSKLKVDPVVGSDKQAQIEVNGDHYEIHGPATLDMQPGYGPMDIGANEQKCVVRDGDKFEVKDSCDGGSGGHWWNHVFGMLPPLM